MTQPRTLSFELMTKLMAEYFRVSFGLSEDDPFMEVVRETVEEVWREPRGTLFHRGPFDELKHPAEKDRKEPEETQA